MDECDWWDLGRTIDIFQFTYNRMSLMAKPTSYTSDAKRNVELVGLPPGAFALDVLCSSMQFVALIGCQQASKGLGV